MERSSLGQHLADSTYVLALLGAGLSAPSGIPTFRGASSSENAMWYATQSALREEPLKVWQYYEERRDMANTATPNAAHFALATLAASKPFFLAVTQNIDDLSQKAGHDRSKLVQLHGSLFETRCTNELCLEPILKTGHANRSEDLTCATCGLGLVRHGVVLFGEKLPTAELDHLDQWLSSIPRLDLMLVVGTSCKVFPAAEYIHRAREKGAYIAHFNLERDEDFIEPGDWYVPGDIASTVPSIVNESLDERLET